MTADLIYPVISIMIYMVVIDRFDSKLPLMILSILSIPACMLFSLQAYLGLYQFMFATDITAFEYVKLSGIAVGCMWVMPIMSIMKTYYLKKFISEMETEDII